MAVGVALLGRLSIQKMHQARHHGNVKHVQKVNTLYKSIGIVRREQWGCQFTIGLRFLSTHLRLFFALFCLKIHSILYHQAF